MLDKSALSNQEKTGSVMTSRRAKVLIPLSLVLAFIIASVALPAAVSAGPVTVTDAAAFARQSLGEAPLVREKAAQPLHASLQRASARGSLSGRDDGRRVWIFFTDKGVRDQAAFVRAAAAVTLTERAASRRAKVGRDHALFADLPVVASYVEQITALGAEHRRSSRWLNAASFLVPSSRLEEVAALPFVAEVRPMATFKRTLPTPESIKLEAPRAPLAPDALDYGSATEQLRQINVPAAHTAGYTGAGVTLAIMDTGYRKSHDAFANHVVSGRVLAEWDFVNGDGNTENEASDNDWSSQWNHGTYIWSVSAGEDAGNIYGPAYRANIILCKTEDVRSETQVEEDNWVAALEFADSVGTDVITTSLGYSTFDDGTGYDYSDLDGQTAVITIAASTTDGLGIVMCNSMGNSGPSSGSLSAPADAFDILSVGNVTSTGTISSSSSRGPTFDGRTKPEVCARGASTRCASASSDTFYTYASGTSLSTPLVAGAACLVIEAHPDWTPAQVREALMMTADRAENPDNDYGWGILDVMEAINYSYYETCCTGESVGNVDGSPDDSVGLGDLTALIDYLFVTYEDLDCPDEADLDQSGGSRANMEDITLGDLTVMIDHLFVSFEALPPCPE